MKYIMLCLACLLSLSLIAATWQTFTNIDHVYDINLNGNDLYLATWGGVVKLKSNVASPQSLSAYYEDTLINTGNGLASNDIRSLAHIGFSNSLWMGSSDAGISIQSAAGMQQLGTSLGLPSLRVNKVLEDQSTVLVATQSGLASFHYLQGVNFPLMLHQYNVQNTGGALASNNVQDMLLTTDNRLFIATSAGLSYVPLGSMNNNASWQSMHGSGSPIPAGVSSKLAINSTRIAIAQGATVFVNSLGLNNSEWQTYNSSHLLTGNNVSSIALDHNNNLWVAYGTWNEDLLSYSRTGNILLSVISPNGTVQHYTQGELGLGNKTISRIVCSENRIFLCSWGDGIYQKEGNIWQNFAPECIGFPKITQITTDKNHAVWFASGNIDNNPVKKGTMGVSKLQNGEWQNYTLANSPINSDNILSIAVDRFNRKWFGTWDNDQSPPGWLTGIGIYDDAEEVWKHFNRDGLRTWNNSTNSWSMFNNSYTLLTSTIGGIYPAGEDYMMVMCYDGGVSVLDHNNQNITEFQVPNSVRQQVLYANFNGEKYFFGTNSDRGLVIWNHPSLPETNGVHWVIPSPPELRNCLVYGVVTVDTPYEGRQNWIAASTGLFMWNGTTWYRYDTMIKRFRYSTNSNQWQNDTLYYVDEERLFGSIRTSPTSILLDPFNRIWIGSLENGISMYNPETERFTNYFKPNVPLLTNQITALGYDPVQGNLMIGTPDGLNTLKIGRTVKPETELSFVKAFPNPFRPARDASVQIVNLPEDSLPAGESTCSIYDTSGALVAKIKENRFSRFEWNGKSTSGKECGSGIYLFVVADEQGNTKRGKFAIIR